MNRFPQQQQQQQQQQQTTTNKKQQTTSNKQQTTNNKQQTKKKNLNCTIFMVLDSNPPFLVSILSNRKNPQEFHQVKFIRSFGPAPGPSPPAAPPLTAPPAAPVTMEVSDSGAHAMPSDMGESSDSQEWVREHTPGETAGWLR